MLKPAGGEGGYIDSPVPCMLLNNDALLLWCPGIFPQTFLVGELLTPVPSGCLFTDNSCPLPGSTFQTSLSSIPPTSTIGDTQLRLECAGWQYRPSVQFLLCLAFHRLSAAFSFDSLKVPFCPSQFAHHEEVFLIVETCPHLQLPTRIAGPLF